MNTSIGLDLNTDGINPFAWEAAYQESLCLISGFEFLDRIIDRTTFPGSEWVYARRTEERRLKRQKYGWQIIGDLTTMQLAEPFSLYKDISYYSIPGHSSDKKPPDIYADYTQRNSQWKMSQGDFPASSINIFHGKTHGYTHHVFLLAIALLIENRFPKRAIVYGNITNDQLTSAIKWANSILDKKLKLPDRSSAQTLISRLQAFYSDPQDLLNAFFTLSIEEKSSRQKHFILPAVAEKDIMTWFNRRLSEHEADSEKYRHYMHVFLQMGFSIADLNNKLAQKYFLHQSNSQQNAEPEKVEQGSDLKTTNPEQINTSEELIIWKPGMKFSPELKNQLDKFIKLVKKIESTKRCKELFYESHYPADKQKTLIELNRHFILRESAWNHIFDNLYNHEYIRFISALMLVNEDTPAIVKFASAILNNKELLRHFFMSDERFFSEQS